MISDKLLSFKYPKVLGDNLISNFTYEPKQFKVKYKDEKGIQRTYQPDFLLKNEIIEIKNKWSAKLKETKIKKEAFKKAFPNIKYQIICW
jgi:hypothetical protein